MHRHNKSKDVEHTKCHQVLTTMIMKKMVVMMLRLMHGADCGHDCPSCS